MISLEYSSATAVTEIAAADSSMQNTGHKMDLQGEADPTVWAAFTENFQQVQSVLDRNRILIQQVNKNHQSKLRENLVKNVALIQEINSNVSKVVELYANLSTNFSTVFLQRSSAGDAKTYSEQK